MLNGLKRRDPKSPECTPPPHPRQPVNREAVGRWSRLELLEGSPCVCLCLSPPLTYPPCSPHFVDIKPWEPRAQVGSAPPPIAPNSACERSALWGPRRVGQGRAAEARSPYLAGTPTRPASMPLPAASRGTEVRISPPPSGAGG